MGGKHRRIAIREKGPAENQFPRLLTAGDNQWGIGLVSRHEVAQRIASSSGSMRVHNYGLARRLGESIDHRDNGRLLNYRHILKTFGKVLQKRLFSGP